MKPSERAQFGRDLIKEAVIQLLRNSERPMTHAQIVHNLGIPSDFEGENSNYLSWSILGLLVNEGAVSYTGDRQKRVYSLPIKGPGLPD
jgi:hypothetical protein